MYIKTSKPIIKTKYGLAAEDSLMIEDAEAQAHVRTQTHTHTHRVTLFFHLKKY